MDCGVTSFIVLLKNVVCSLVIRLSSQKKVKIFCNIKVRNCGINNGPNNVCCAPHTKPNNTSLYCVDKHKRFFKWDEVFEILCKTNNFLIYYRTFCRVSYNDTNIPETFFKKTYLQESSSQVETKTSWRLQRSALEISNELQFKYFNQTAGIFLLFDY